MPTYSLQPHPDNPDADGAVTVTVSREANELRLTYAIDPVLPVWWPFVQQPGRGDELWKQTCFELFLKRDGDEGYLEFNFSPSRRWAAYAFESYRGGRTNLADDAGPRVVRTRHGVEAWCPIADRDEGWRMGLSAVVALADGTKLYWALAHAPGPPDFHNPACFTAHLPPPPRP